MNQYLQRRVYMLGTDEQAEFIADRGGMKGEVRQMFLLFHEGRKERYICDTLGIEHDAFAILENMVAVKFVLGVFDCINYRMAHRD